MNQPSSDFPLKVPCPKCNAAVGAKCSETKFSLGSSTRPVDWFHFSRIDRATLNGFNQATSIEWSKPNA